MGLFRFKDDSVISSSVAVALKFGFLQAKVENDETTTANDGTDVTNPAPAEAVSYVGTNKWTMSCSVSFLRVVGRSTYPRYVPIAVANV